jgi:hypothetical protein
MYEYEIEIMLRVSIFRRSYGDTWYYNGVVIVTIQSLQIMVYCIGVVIVTIEDFVMVL